MLRPTSHTRLRARDHYTSSTLIGGKAGTSPSSLLHTTLEGPTEYVNARWMLKSTWMPSYMASNGIMFHGHVDYFQKPPLGGRPNTKPGDHDTPNAHNRWFILFYHVWGPAWIDIDWNSIWLRARHIWLHTTLEDAYQTTWFGRCVGTAFGHFPLGSHNFMVTALGSCVKWPLICTTRHSDDVGSRLQHLQNLDSLHLNPKWCRPLRYE